MDPAENNNEPQRIGIPTLDDIDNLSLNSLGFGETDINGPVSVREMIRRYNSAAKANAQISCRSEPPSPSYKKYNSHTNLRNIFVENPKNNDDVLEEEVFLSSASSTSGIKNVEFSLQNKASCSSLLTISNMGNETGSVNATFFVDHPRISGTSIGDGCEIKAIPSSLEEINATQQSLIAAENSTEELNTQTCSASYQSKTTIAKTSSGVRITIDIFFDHNDPNGANVVGSRVETDIPQSRILTEFQEQAISTPSSME